MQAVASAGQALPAHLFRPSKQLEWWIGSTLEGKFAEKPVFLDLDFPYFGMALGR